MGLRVVEATKARCMRRNRNELRLLVRAVFFLLGLEDFLRECAGLDCGFAPELALSAACANSGADEHPSVLKHSTKRKNLENPATFL